MMMMHSSSARSRRSTSLRRNNSNSRRQVRRSFSNKCKTSMAQPSSSLLDNDTRTRVDKDGFNPAPRDSLSALDLKDNNDRKEEEQHGDDDSLVGLLDNNHKNATPLRRCRHPFSNKTKLKPQGSALSSSSVLVVIRRATISSKKKRPPPCSSIYELLVQEDDNNANDIDDCQKEFIVKKNSETNVNHNKKKTTNDDQAMMMEFDVFVEHQQDGSMRLTACEVDQYITTLMTRTTTTQAHDCIITFGLDFDNGNASDRRTSMIRTRNPDVARRLVKQQQAASLSLSLSRVLEDEPHQQLLNNNKPHHQPHHHHDEEEVSSLSISTDSNLQRQEQEQLLQQVHASSDGSSTTKASVASVSSSNHHHQNNQTAIRTKAPVAPQRQQQPQRSSSQQQTRQEFRIPVAHSKFPPVKAFQMFILRDCPHINQTFHMESYYDTATNKGPRRRRTMRRRRDCFDPVRYHLIVDHGNGSLRFHLSAKQVLDHVQEQLTHHQCLFWLCLLLGRKDNNPQEDDNNKNKQPPVYTKTCDPYVARALVRQDSLSYQPHQQQPESTTPVMMEKVLQWMQRAWYKRNKNKNMKKHHQW